MSVSLDGYVAAPDGSIGFAHISEELHQLFNEEARSLGTMLLGRRMYELLAPYWPTADQDPAASPAIRDFAQIWREKRKVVFSTTLDEVDATSRLVRADPVAEVRRLKQVRDNDMDVGGPTLAATLIAADLVDEFRLYVNPVVLGGGMPYLSRNTAPLELRLLEMRRFDGDVVYLRYERARQSAAG